MSKRKEKERKRERKRGRERIENGRKIVDQPSSFVSSAMQCISPQLAFLPGKDNTKQKKDSALHARNNQSMRSKTQ